MTPLRVAILGGGRLGREIEAMLPAHDAVLHLLGTRQAPVSPAALRGADVVIDVSVAEAVVSHTRIAAEAGVPIAIGSTGWQGAEAEVRRVAAEARLGVLVAPNFSLGVALFTGLFAEAVRRLSPAAGFDAHLVETHHHAKKDAPSGTAVRLLAAAGQPALPVTSVRVGQVPGTHAAIFDGRYEQVTLTHEARDRRVFADGALRAARWLVGRYGWFTMDDVVTDLIGSQR